MGQSMIRIRRGTVLRVLAETAGRLDLAVEVEGAEARAIAYPAITGPTAPGDVVLLNTTAVALGLGSGGSHVVIGVEGRESGEAVGPAHLMKLRYTPDQVQVQGVEEESSPHHETMAGADALDAIPVLWLALHSMLGPAAAGAVAAGAERVVYVMTDGAALPVALSRLVATLRGGDLVQGVVTAGQSFGGDLEAVTTFSGLLAARHVAGADVILVGDGPGNTGSRTRWGASNVGSAMSLNAAAILGGRPVAGLRISFADPRPEHRAVSHHSITALSRVAMTSVHVAVPVIENAERRSEVWDALRSARLEERHQLVEVGGEVALAHLRGLGITPDSMGRTPADDPECFLASGAAGVLAGRMAARGRAWTRTDPSEA
jgi:hypothetical protein